MLRLALIALTLFGCEESPCAVWQFSDGTPGLSCGGPQPFVCYRGFGCAWLPAPSRPAQRQRDQ